MRKALAFIAFLCPSLAFSLSPLFSMGGQLGGDKPERVNGFQLESLALGAGAFFSFGAQIDLSKTQPHAYQMRTHVGINIWEVGGENGNRSSWVHLPVSFDYLYVNTRNQFKAGYGLTYHIANHLSSQQDGINRGFHFKNSLGYSLFLEAYNDQGTGSFSSGIRYTMIDYVESFSNQRFKGDSLGFYYLFSL